MPTVPAASSPRGDDGTLTTVAPENFPAEGVEVLLPYPQGTNRSRTFVITHMITSGERAGQIETLKGTSTKGGILVRFTSMSPVCITYQVHTSTGADRTAAVGVSSPRTADSSRVALWSAACVCSAALLLSITVKRRNTPDKKPPPTAGQGRFFLLLYCHREHSRSV